MGGGRGLEQCRLAATGVCSPVDSLSQGESPGLLLLLLLFEKQARLWLWWGLLLLFEKQARMLLWWCLTYREKLIP